MLVDHGRIQSYTRDPWPWVNNTVGNNVPTWRSGIGLDARGDLIYVAAKGLSENGLASLLQHAGATQAMALDENPHWVNLFTYGAPNAGNPSRLLPWMPDPLNRYLVPDQRDFFMVLGK